MKLVAVSVLLIIGMTVVAWFSAWSLRRSHAKDVRVVAYIFSMALVVTSLIALWASSIGALGENGEYEGKVGKYLNSIFSFVMDLNADLKVLLSVLALAILPQAIAYCLCGLVGCASSLLFVERVVSFVVWSLVKSFATAAGVVTSVSAFAYFSHWKGSVFELSLSVISLAFGLNALALSIVFFYRDPDNVTESIKRSLPDWFIGFLAATHAWCTRASNALKAHRSTSKQSAIASKHCRSLRCPTQRATHQPNPRFERTRSTWTLGTHGPPSSSRLFASDPCIQFGLVAARFVT